MKQETLYQQYRRVKMEYPQHIALLHEGKMLIAHDDDARAIGKILGVMVVQNCAGFPFSEAEAQISKLLDAGRTVAIIEQVVNPKPEQRGQAKKLTFSEATE